jgi:hypothetical protein
LLAIFKRDIEENVKLNFCTKIIRPIQGEEPAMVILFKHLTIEEIQIEDENGKKYPKRVFEMSRSQRLHWIKYHLEEIKKKMFWFLVLKKETKRKDKIL